MKNKIVFLTGFMASGKSTIGPILANTLGWNFADIDRMIEARCGKKISKIFEDEGEKFFREQERKVLKEIVNYNEYIIALGGGTIVNQSNLDLIKSNGLVVYLESSPEEAYKRLKFKRDRPILKFDNDEEPTKAKYLKRINEILESRKKFYDQADIKINTDNIRVGKAVDQLAKIISNKLLDEKNKS